MSVKVTTIDPNFISSSSFFSSFFSSSSFSVGPAHPVTNMRFLRDSFFFFGEEKVGRWRIEIEMLSRLMGD